MTNKLRSFIGLNVMLALSVSPSLSDEFNGKHQNPIRSTYELDLHNASKESKRIIRENNLNRDKIKLIEFIYNIGHSIKASDGTKFGYSLVAIYGAESTFGEYIIGDKYFKNGREKPLYLKSLSGFQIKVSTAIETIQKNKELSEYSHLINGKRSPLIVSRLLNDVEFSSKIAGYFLKSLYERARTKKYNDPWRKAIGKYNGGWYNKVYYPRIIGTLGDIKKLKKHNILKLAS